jgi:hypothetical protein
LQVHSPPPQDAVDLDASHLCGQQWCCRPSHLAWESRLYNISRRGCAGFVLLDSGTWVRVCTHNPPCKIATRATTCGQPVEEM